jgi:hypothetical protein
MANKHPVWLYIVMADWTQVQTPTTGRQWHRHSQSIYRIVRLPDEQGPIPRRWRHAGITDGGDDPFVSEATPAGASGVADTHHSQGGATVDPG